MKNASVLQVEDHPDDEALSIRNCAAYFSIAFYETCGANVNLSPLATYLA
jgi:hypothetical protein